MIEQTCSGTMSEPMSEREERARERKDVNAQWRLLNDTGDDTLTPPRVQSQERKKKSGCFRPFIKHRYVRPSQPTHASGHEQSLAADGVAITRAAPRKKLGMTYRKHGVTKTPEAALKEDLGVDVYDDVDEYGMKKVSNPFRQVLHERDRVDDIQTLYRPNASDTLPHYAIKLAIQRDEKGEARRRAAASFIYKQVGDRHTSQRQDEEWEIASDSGSIEGVEELYKYFERRLNSVK